MDELYAGGAFVWHTGQRVLRFGPSFVWRDVYGFLWDEVGGVCSMRGCRGRTRLHRREDVERARGPLVQIGGAPC